MILAARGEDIVIRIQGEELLSTRTNSIVFEAACTSMQLHLQVDPHEFGLYWNAAQAMSAPLLAAATNSPFFLGKQLHHETRIALFEQAADTRTEELILQGVRPRVWFGEKWLDEGEGLWELFDENVRYFPALLPICDDNEDPGQVLNAGDVPTCRSLTLHNGTIYRWNRPVYEVFRGRPHMRIENRVLPAGPSVPDSVANSVLYYGLLQGIVSRPRPYLWEQMLRDRQGQLLRRRPRRPRARLYWPRVGLRFRSRSCSCAPAAARAPGSARLGRRRGGCRVLPRDHRGTDLSGMTGADWQIATWRTLIDDHGFDRAEAARARPAVPATFLFEHAGPHLAGRRLTGRVDRGPVPCQVVTDLYHRFDGYDDLKSLLEGSDEESWSSSAAGPDPHPRCRHGGQPTGAVRRLPPARQRTVRLPGGARGTPAQRRVSVRLVGADRQRPCGDAGRLVRPPIPGRSGGLQPGLGLRAGHHPHAPLRPVDPRGMRGRPGGRHRPAQQHRAEPLLRDTPRASAWRECGWRRLCRPPSAVALHRPHLMEALADLCPTAAVECGLPHLPGDRIRRQGSGGFLDADGFAVPFADPCQGPAASSRWFIA